jgi:cytochrome b involved in lipid metabolism
MSPRPENSVSSSNSIENATESKFVATNPIDKDVVVQVDDVLYDAMALARVHPGGELFLKAFSGFDATEAFLSYHR